MFGIEKLISKPLLKLIYNSENDITITKTVMGVEFLVHLISVGLMAWMLYRLLIKKQKTTANLVIPIIGAVISLLIPYNTGEEGIDFILGMFSKVSTFAMMLTFIGLIMAITSIVLYFTYKEEKKDEEIKAG